MKSVAFKFARPLPLLCLCLLPFPAAAQSPASSIPPALRTPADVEWETIRLDAYQVPAAAGAQPADRAGQEAAAAQRASNLVEKANRAREFHRKNNRHGKSAEARRLEAVLLLNAVQIGESSVEGRARQTVEEIRQDRTLPEAMRAEVVGTAGFMGTARKNLQGAELFAAYEGTARLLITEFPGQPQGYESLVAIARDGDPSHGRALAQELLGLPAPEPVKQQARFLLDRYALVGQPLAGVLAEAGHQDAENAVKKNRPTLIYTWATWSPGSIKLGQDLAQRSLGGINVLAINLDADLASAQTLAASSGITGTLLYDARGPSGPLAQGLKLAGAPQVYFVDAKGVITDVRGTDNLLEKLTALGL